jgi:hypothetical protein
LRRSSARHSPATPPVTPTGDAARDPAGHAARRRRPPAADLSKFEKELGDTGKLSDASYAELEKLGYPKATVDNYIAGQQAVAAQLAQQVFAVVGGQDKMQQMMTWAEGSFTPAEQTAFNEAMMSGDVNKAKLAATRCRPATPRPTARPRTCSAASPVLPAPPPSRIGHRSVRRWRTRSTRTTPPTVPKSSSGSVPRTSKDHT